MWFLVSRSSREPSAKFEQGFENEADLERNVQFYRRLKYEFSVWRGTEITMQEIVPDTDAVYFVARSRTGENWDWINQAACPNAALRAAETTQRVGWKYRLWRATPVAVG